MKTLFSIVLAAALCLADPFVCHYDGKYYIFGTGDPDGFKAYSSTDLVNWTLEEGGARDGYALHKDDVIGDKMFWAPEVYHVGDLFYMLYTAEEKVCIAVSESITGPYRTHGSGLLTDDRCGIDNTLFQDDDGKYYMYWVRFDLGKGNEIRSSLLSDDLTHVVGEQHRCIFAKKGWERHLGTVTEGPTVFKHNGLYYMTYSANDYRSQDYAVGFAVAKSPLGPWKKYRKNPILHRIAGLVGTGHSSVFLDEDGKMRMVFHSHWSKDKVGPRRTFITGLSFRKAGGKDVLVAGEDVIELQLSE